MFERVLMNMLEDISFFKHTKQELEEKYIKERLQRSFDSYEHDLSLSCDYISNRDAINVMKKMNRR